MDFSTAMTGSELSKLQSQVDTFNKIVNSGRVAKDSLDKDDFLSILLTQLQHQDPTEPMDDKEFIAQLAQFSTLEQITNMSSEFSKMSNLISSSQAMSLLGKSVDIMHGEALISGMVQEVTGGNFPQIMVNGVYYDFTSVERVKQ
jgi:flagellar basal-body rod modification protein FlgD